MPGPIALGENKYKCRFCKRTGGYPALVAHVQTHEKTAVKHKGMCEMLSCKTKCFPLLGEKCDVFFLQEIKCINVT